MIRICHVANDFDKKSKYAWYNIRNVFLNIWWVHCAFIKIVLCCRWCCQCCAVTTSPYSSHQMYVSIRKKTEEVFFPYRDKNFCDFFQAEIAFQCVAFCGNDELQLKQFKINFCNITTHEDVMTDTENKYLCNSTHHVFSCFKSTKNYSDFLGNKDHHYFI